ncbi:hypothetical protein BDZ89DRAFT_1068347 [Hymenopellis radicata]|nr:hypothetical protein BDZ89DRAFT_1068347 [Hymenopellis radicata]
MASTTRMYTLVSRSRSLHVKFQHDARLLRGREVNKHRRRRWLMMRLEHTAFSKRAPCQEQ